MRNVFLLITVIIFFIASGLVFWAGLAPKSFSNFFSWSSEITDTASKAGLLRNQNGDFSDNIFSEPVSGVKGDLAINNVSWVVEVVKDEQSRVAGLSNRKTLSRQNGLLFVFDKAGNQSFWMKDMLLSIDMIFFDSNWKIVEIDSDISPNSYPQIFGSKVKSQYVLETNAGEALANGLQVGDQAIYTNK